MPGVGRTLVTRPRLDRAGARIGVSHRRLSVQYAVDQDSYLLAQAPGRPDRQGALSALFDWWTFRHLDAVGIGPSWHCWEVGAGGPGVVRWLAGRVGPTGHVLATDLDVSRLVASAGAAVEVRRHDVVADPVPAAAFDLVHARLVLVHLAERERVLRSLAAAVRPGGWLVVEDADPELQPLACPDVPDSRVRSWPTRCARHFAGCSPGGAPTSASDGRFPAGCVLSA